MPGFILRRLQLPPENDDTVKKDNEQEYGSLLYTATPTQNRCSTNTCWLIDIASQIAVLQTEAEWLRCCG